MNDGTAANRGFGAEIAQTWSARHKKLHLVDDTYHGVVLVEGPRVRWKDIPLTNIRIVDSDHRDLVKLINKLAVDHDRKASAGILDLTIDQFNQYALEHFRREEALMWQFQFPGYIDHRERHLAFRRFFHAVRIVWKNDRRYLDVGRILDFLSEWLARHVGGSDMAYVDAVANAKHSGEGDIDGDAHALSEEELAGILATVEKILRAETRHSVRLRQQIHDLHTKQTMDIDLDQARALVQELRAD